MCVCDTKKITIAIKINNKQQTTNNKLDDSKKTIGGIKKYDTSFEEKCMDLSMEISEASNIQNAHTQLSDVVKEIFVIAVICFLFFPYIFFVAFFEN